MYNFFFREQPYFLLIQAGKRCRQCHQRGLGGSSDVEASLLGPDPVYPPLSAAPSLTCWQLQMEKIWAWSYEQDRWERVEPHLVTTAQGHGDGKLLTICCCTRSYIYYDRVKAKASAGDLIASRLNCNRYFIRDARFQSKHGRLTLKGSSLPLKCSPLCYLGFPLWRILLCGPFMGQGASYAPVLVLCWWISSLWACGNKLNPSIYLHMARPIHLL